MVRHLAVDMLNLRHPKEEYPGHRWKSEAAGVWNLGEKIWEGLDYVLEA